MQDYIPLEVIESATKQLIAEAAKKLNPKSSVPGEVEILYETIHFRDSHSGIPTLYKIVLRYPYNTVEKRCLWGVWTEKGQRLELP